MQNEGQPLAYGGATCRTYKPEISSWGRHRSKGGDYDALLRALPNFPTITNALLNKGFVNKRHFADGKKLSPGEEHEVLRHARLRLLGGQSPDRREAEDWHETPGLPGV